MAITREQVLAAVEKYLPRTVNYARSADFGDRDPVPVFERIQQILFTTLLVDQDAVFYIVFLTSQRLLTSINEVISELELLSSTQQLKGITGDDPTRIEDLTQLSSARTSLVRLSTNVAQEGTFGEANLADFQADLEGFMVDQVVPNVAGGNKAKISSDIRSNMAALKASWADVLAKRDRVFSVLDKYVDEDLRTRVSALIISAIQGTLADLERALPALSTEVQAANAESILVELAAAEAAITVVGNAPSPLGVLVAGPADDGRTASSYLALEGTGRTEPVLPLLTGEDGLLRLEGPNAGAPFTSLSGQTVGPGPTALLSDASVPDFTTEGIAAGMYLTLVDRGTTHQVTNVTPTQLTLSPKTPHVAASPQRYAITDHAPGRYFESPSSNFWVEDDIAAQSTMLSSLGTSGSWQRVNKVTGSDGTNVYASGADGVTRPRKVEGAASTQPLTSSNFTTDLADPGFLSNSVTTSDLLYIVGLPNSVGNPYGIASINGEHDLDITTTWGSSGGGPWYLEDPITTPTRFRSSSGTFLTDGVLLGDYLVLGAPVSTTLLVTSIYGQFELGLLVSPLTHNTSVPWELVTAGNDRLYSASVNFAAAGVVVGDLVDISGEGTFTVLEVRSNYIRLSGALSSFSPTLSGLAFEVYAAPGTNTTVFTQADGDDFAALEVASTVPVTEYFAGAAQVVRKPAYLEVDGVTYRVQSRIDATTVTVFPLVEGSGSTIALFGTAGALVAADTTFVSSGVDPSKHELVILSGPSAGTYAITVVTNELQLLIDGSGIVSGAGNYFEIRPKLASGLSWNVNHGTVNRRVVHAGFFLPEDVGAIFVWKRGTADEVRIRVDTYISANEVWLAQGVGPASLGLQPAAIIRLVKPGMLLYANGRRYTIRDIKDETTLDIDPKMSNAPGVDIDFIVMTAGTNLYSSRIYDPVGAAELDAINGFTDTYKNATVNLMVDAPVKARYLQAYDPGLDGFAEAFQVNTNLKLGRRRVTYQLLVDFDNQSNLFVASETSPLPLADDYLTVWGLAPIFTVTASSSATPYMELTVRPGMQSKLLDQTYAVHRGGSQFYGRWVLYDTQNSQLTLDATTDLLRLKVAEVLIDFGELDVIAIDSGVAGVVADDGDEDGAAFVLEDAGASFSEASFGDRLKVTYPDMHVETTFVTVVLSGTRVRFDPAVSEGTGLAWTLERNSVSSALAEADRLLRQMQQLRDLVEAYVVDRNATVDGILDLLQDQRLDRAVDLLLDGRVDEFINLEAATSSYSSQARTAIQGVGSRTTPTSVLDTHVAGIDPTTGKPSPSATKATSRSSADGVPEDVDVRIALAKALAEISGDETIRSLAFNTFEEQRNRAIFELCGEVESGFISDEDPTLPWVARTGSLRARVNARYRKALAAVQYMIDHPDEFDTIE